MGLGWGRGLGCFKSLAGDNSIGAWIWQGTGTREGERYTEGAGAGEGVSAWEWEGTSTWAWYSPGRTLGWDIRLGRAGALEEK